MVLLHIYTTFDPETRNLLIIGEETGKSIEEIHNVKRYQYGIIVTSAEKPKLLEELIKLDPEQTQGDPYDDDSLCDMIALFVGDKKVSSKSD